MYSDRKQINDHLGEGSVGRNSRSMRKLLGMMDMFVALVMVFTGEYIWENLKKYTVKWENLKKIQLNMCYISFYLTKAVNNNKNGPIRMDIGTNQSGC